MRPLFQGEFDNPAHGGVVFRHLMPLLVLVSDEVVHASPTFYHGGAPESVDQYIHKTLGKLGSP
jgi:hypothetical protein